MPKKRDQGIGLNGSVKKRNRCRVHWIERPYLSTSKTDAPTRSDEQALVSLKIKEIVDAERWCTKTVVIEGG